MFVFADLIIHHKYWLSYSGVTGRIFLSQMTLLRWLTFLLQIPDCDCHSLALLDLQSDLCITTTWGTKFPWLLQTGSCYKKGLCITTRTVNSDIWLLHKGSIVFHLITYGTDTNKSPCIFVRSKRLCFDKTTYKKLIS